MFSRLSTFVGCLFLYIRNLITHGQRYAYNLLASSMIPLLSPHLPLPFNFRGASRGTAVRTQCSYGCGGGCLRHPSTGSGCICPHAPRQRFLLNSLSNSLITQNQRYAFDPFDLSLIPPIVPPTCPFRFTPGMLREGLWGTPVPQTPS
jgi:hypothetical protein